jgi:urease accessory protein
VKGFTARAAVAAELGPDGRTRVSRLRSDGPLAVRASGPAQDTWHPRPGREPTHPAEPGRGARDQDSDRGDPRHGGDAREVVHRAEPGRGARDRRTSGGEPVHPAGVGRDAGELVHLVGAGAGPVGGDELELSIDVGAGARLVVRSVAAALVLPGRGARPSRLVVRARVADGGSLVFCPEPSIAAAGCDHRAYSEVRLGDGAELVWWEEIVLGRHGERPGRYVSRFDVTACGKPLLRHEVRVDDDAASVAVLGDAKAVGTLLLAGPYRVAEACAEQGMAVLPLAGPGVLVTALAEDALRLRERLERGGAAVTGPVREPAPRRRLSPL